jgi:DNA-binding CsgD family transcriptional regulator
MSSIFQRLAKLFRSARRKQDTRAFSYDGQFAMTLTEIARRQNRDQSDVLQSILKAGVDEILRNDKYSAAWDALSPREKEVTALICLGYSSYEIAGTLYISYDTVRTHSKHIYVKFGLKRKELREALKDWRFAEWWENHNR